MAEAGSGTLATEGLVGRGVDALEPRRCVVWIRAWPEGVANQPPGNIGRMAARPGTPVGGVAPTQPTEAVDCTIIVVTHNSERHIQAFLDSVAAAAGSVSCRVVAVDNHSTDRTAEILRDVSQVVFLELGANLGYSAGINAGRRRAGPCDSILIANPDVRLVPGSIERLHRAVTLDGYGAAVPRLLDERGTPTWSLRREPTIGRQLGEALLGNRFTTRPAWLSEIVRDPDAYRRAGTVDWASGAVVMVAAACDTAVGAWDETYFLFSEEVDYAERIRRHGYALVYLPDAQAVHEEGGSGRREDLMSLLAVNRLRYYRRRHGRMATACYTVALLLQLVLRGGDGAHRRAAVNLSRAGLPAILWNRFPSSDELRARPPASPRSTD